MTAGLPDEDLVRQFDNGWDKAEGETNQFPVTRGSVARQPHRRSSPPPPPTPASPGGVIAAHPVYPRKDSAALQAVLAALRIDLRYDTRAHRAQFRRDGGPWEDLHDRNTDHLREEIAAGFRYHTTRGAQPLAYGTESWTRVSNALLNDVEVDPFREWLEALPPWDGTLRLREWLEECFTVAAQPEELVTWAAQFVFLGAVTRTYRPGTKLDEMPVLIGPKGIGKSSVLRHVLPLDYPSWFSDGTEPRSATEGTSRGAARPRHRRSRGDGRGQPCRAGIAQSLPLP